MRHFYHFTKTILFLYWAAEAHRNLRNPAARSYLNLESKQKQNKDKIKRKRKKRKLKREKRWYEKKMRRRPHRNDQKSAAPAEVSWRLNKRGRETRADGVSRRCKSTLLRRSTGNAPWLPSTSGQCHGEDK